MLRQGTQPQGLSSVNILYLLSYCRKKLSLQGYEDYPSEGYEDHPSRDIKIFPDIWPQD